MRFALTARTQAGIQTLGWSNEPDDLDDVMTRVEGFKLIGSEYLMQRCRRHVLLGRHVGAGGNMVEASLDTPYPAYATMVSVFREHGGVQGPIDFAGTDDDGIPIDFVPQGAPGDGTSQMSG